MIRSVLFVVFGVVLYWVALCILTCVVNNLDTMGFCVPNP